MAATVPPTTTSVEHATGAQTLPEMICQSVARHDGAALRFPRGDRWVDLSYPELAATVRKIAGGLVALGVRPGEPTQKAKRAVVHARFKDVLDSLYQ